jgi:hypothetical protein
MLKCRKWRRERESILRTLASKKIQVSTIINGQDLGILLEEASIETVLRFIECTAVGKRREVYDAQRIDEWDIDQLGQESDEDWEG